MNVSINTIEQESWKDSIIHRLDGRIKLILVLMIIFYSVYTTNFKALFFLEIYVIFLVIASKISLKFFFKRILLILPFGGAIALLQPFIKPGLVLFSLPLGLQITYEGVMFGALLLSRLMVSLSSIVLLSSVTPIDDIVRSMRRLKFPKILTTLLSMTIRYLFLFFEELNNIRNAQKTRGFDIWNKKTSYLWRVKQVGNTIVMLFLKSFEKGESVYNSMLSRSYTGEPVSYNQESNVHTLDYVLLITTILIIVFIELINYL